MSFHIGIVSHQLSATFDRLILALEGSLSMLQRFVGVASDGMAVNKPPMRNSPLPCPLRQTSFEGRKMWHIR